MLYLIDTNVLVLLIIGLSGEEALKRGHRRLEPFAPHHFPVLIDLLGDAPRVITTPAIVAETSNLLCYASEPLKTTVMATFQKFLSNCSEHYLPSTIASARADFRWRGVTDCGIIELVEPKFHLITADHPLYQHFAKSGRPATNFWHAIESANQL